MDLDLTREQRTALGQAVLDWVVQWFDFPSDRRLYPDVTEADLYRAVHEAVPAEGADPAAVLHAFAELVKKGGKDAGNARHFGYVHSTQAFVAVLGDFLASALNQNVTSWRSAPLATAIERETIDWIKTLLGFDADGLGLLVSGGSVANLIGIAAALTRAAPAVGRDGVRSLTREPVIYASKMTHMSVMKAAAMLGLGRKAVRLIDVDRAFRMDVGQLRAALDSDRDAGRQAVCIVANAGDVNTGAIDPLEELSDIARQYGTWLHADGAYGGFAALSPSGAAALRGLSRADSMSLDPHKWLYVPIDAGCVLVKDPLALTRAFSYAADYVDVISNADASKFAFWDYGPELSRRFRALKIWMLLKTHGTRAIGEIIERNIRLAGHLGTLVDDDPDFERLAPVSLSIVCFRYVTPVLRAGLIDADPHARERSRQELNALNQATMLEVQNKGNAYLSNTTIDGAFALRACIVNHRTRESDIALLLREIRSAAASCAKAASTAS
jgi:aromatic-L-amino-acid/L-tryptophan decarboxylase